MARKKKETQEKVAVETINEEVVTETISADATKEQIRTLVSGIYDLQKLRISMGNRLVQLFYRQHGVIPSMSPENADKEDKKVIDKLKAEYKRISDGVALNNKTVKSTIKELSNCKNREDNIEFITNTTEYSMVQSYMDMLNAEESSVKALDAIVKTHPMWDAFFKNVKGCGTLMSAVCIAYFDPYKANHVSSFFRYAGLDVVQNVDESGRPLFIAVDDKDKKLVYAEFSEENIEPVYKYTDTNEVYTGEVVMSTHGRRKGDVEMMPYFVVNEKGEKVMALDENGKPKLKRGITYNPKLKTKLMGVLAGCLLKAGLRKGEAETEWAQIYVNQRQRLDNSAFHSGKSSAQKNQMAQRYMIKEFIRQMWRTWRELEGLEVDEPYEVAVLGHRPHHCTDVLKQEKAS